MRKCLWRALCFVATSSLGQTTLVARIDIASAARSGHRRQRVPDCSGGFEMTRCWHLIMVGIDDWSDFATATYSELSGRSAESG